jgi:hypothetical protein
MPIYVIATKGEDEQRLVKAESAAQAIRHCARDKFTARTVSRAEEAAEIMTAGVKLETAGAEPVEPQATPPKND